MYYRRLTERVQKSATYNPIVAILGPRQSGKTTLAKMAFPNYAYYSFENMDVQALVQADLKAFLKNVTGKGGVIFDEFQRVPQLLNNLQGVVDESGRMGEFILTGSQNYLMSERITQSLAGRVALFTLLPLDQQELAQAGILPASPEAIMAKGCYPRIYWQNASFDEWYDDYIFAYLERDIRGLKHVNDLLLFKRFMEACAARTGQLISYAELARDVQISVQTATSWLSLLAASYSIFLLPAYHNNFSKRVAKSPKLYFYETALAMRLLGITEDKLHESPTLKGHFFENYVISEIAKEFSHQKKRPQMYFWQTASNNEIDCIIELNGQIRSIEIKSSTVLKTDMLKGLRYGQEELGITPRASFLVYGGNMSMEQEQCSLIAWNDLKKLFE